MKLFVDTRIGPVGSTFSFDLSDSNKLFDIKKGIEESQGIPVSMQRLFFKGVELLLDHYHLTTYRIVSNSRLLLLLRDDHVNKQMHHQSPYAIQGPPSHARESFSNQDLSTMARSNQVPPSHASEASYGQVLHQESVFESFSMDEYLERAPEPWTAQDIRKLQGFSPGTSTGDNVNIQESMGRNSKNQDLLQNEPSLPPNTFGDFSFDEDLTNIQSYCNALTTHS
ncbi:hypothetical protein N665_1436s0013 [Sinapis alba]|nr:hypothetical protein N665_1436s0013 [Sinapis alba]